MHLFIYHIPGEDNHMAYVASQLAHLYNFALLAEFCLHSQQSTLWHLLSLLSKCRRKLTSMLHVKQYSKVFSLGKSEGCHRLETMARLLWLDPHPL